MDKKWDGWSALAWLERDYLSRHNGGSATAASTAIQVRINIDCMNAGREELLFLSSG